MLEFARDSQYHSEVKSRCAMWDQLGPLERGRGNRMHKKQPWSIVNHLFSMWLSGVLLAGAVATAEVAEIESVKDNTLYEEYDVMLSNGSGDHFFVAERAVILK